MKEKCLIGYTGFIGKNLDEMFLPDDKYNSSNIESIIGKKYNTIFFAGNSSLKWKANKFPEQDWDNIQRAMKILIKIELNRFVLISTIDVFHSPCNVKEDNCDSSEKHNPYGLHRFKFEKFIRIHFPNHTILRLPIVYGFHFKKNAIFDLLHANEIDKLDPLMMIQIYNVGNLKEDILFAIKNNISVLNVATEPILLGEIAQEVFGLDLKLKDQYHIETSMKSKYAIIRNRIDYLYSKSFLIKELKQFVNIYKNKYV